METAMINAMCRCCASEGAFKDVKSRYHWMGEEEIYADMLKDCFDVELSSSEGGDGGICEVCITQLRNAVNFKKQVLHTEEQFKKHVQNKLFKPNIVKVEVTADDGNDSDDNLASEDVYSGPEFEIPIKTEVPEEPKSKKRSAASKATTSRAKKSKTEDGETSTKRDQQKVTRGNNSCNAPTVLLVTKKKETNRDNSSKELAKHRQNLKEILFCSNATPILRLGRIGYMCAYCKEEFIEPVKLKIHTLEIHGNETTPMKNYFKTAILSEYMIRLDITGLRCILCYVYINTLEELMKHLADKHNKVIHKDINNHILPFKFDNDEQLTCCVCSNVFDKFKVLQEHMHKHYRNHICVECDSGYVNKISLTRHKRIHRKGAFPCSYCSKVFDTHVTRKTHIRTMHTHSNVVNRCGYCNEGFKDHRYKEEHLAKVHGLKRKLSKCSACDRCFSTMKKLTAHVKKDHLMEKTHKCMQCDMTFFRSHDLTNHMVKHTGERKYQCNVCSKSYGRKSTLRGHMRIHNNDRRFKCEHCAQSFVQKCSWKSHMKSKHGESV